MSNILPIMALIVAGIGAVQMFGSSTPNKSYKGGKRRTRRNRK